MDTFLSKVRNEPAVVAGVLMGAAALFGVQVTEPEADLAVHGIALLAPIVAGLVTRRHVTPKAVTGS